jgi:ribosome maturation protein SDO1
MVSLDEAVLARYSKGQHHFEIYVDPDLALKYREGEDVNISDILAVEEIFKNASAADKASEHVMRDVFGTTDVLEIAKEIIKEGEIQLTTAQRKKLTEEKTKKIVSMIASRSINPQTNTPHTPERIAKAMEEARVHVDMFKPAEDQIPGIMKAIASIIPIKFETIVLAVKIPPEYAGKCYSVVREYDLRKEEWQKDGSYIAMVEIPAGIQDEFYDKMNAITRGNVETKIIERK